MGSLSIWHWLLVILVVVLLFGRGKISDLMGDVAKGIKSFKKGMADDTTEANAEGDKTKSLEQSAADFENVRLLLTADLATQYYNLRAIDIGFNPDFLRDGLEAISSETIQFKLINRLRPGLIASPDESFWYLIMPIRLAG